MKEVLVTRIRDNKSHEIGIKVDCAHTWFRRLKGLLATVSLPNNRGLWLKPCNSIHTMGMLYTIDVVFLDANGGIVKVAPKVVPMWFSFAPRGVESVLELSTGNIEQLDLKVGDRLEFTSAK